MANYTYSSDLIDDIMQRAGEPDDGSSDFESRTLRYLNRAYLSICKGGAEFAPEIDEDWLWLTKRPPGSLTLLPKITTGTITVTNNSTSAVLSSAPSVNVTNYFLKVNNSNTWYRISNHSGVNLTLNSVYVGDTTAGASYALYNLEYSLAADFLRLTGVMRGSIFQECNGVPLDTLERSYPLAALSEDFPSNFAFVSGTVVRFSHSVTEMTRIEYQYLYRPTLLTGGSSEEPLVPIDYRHLLADIALYFILVDKHSDKAAGLLPVIRNGLVAMSRDNKFEIAKMNNLYASSYPRQKYNKYKLTAESGLFIPISS